MFNKKLKQENKELKMTIENLEMALEFNKMNTKVVCSEYENRIEMLKKQLNDTEKRAIKYYELNKKEAKKNAKKTI